MKATTLILIFSGLTGLTECSSEIKIDLPVFSHDKNIAIEETKSAKFEKTKDTISISSFFHQAIVSYNHQPIKINNPTEQYIPLKRF